MGPPLPPQGVDITKTALWPNVVPGLAGAVDSVILARLTTIVQMVMRIEDDIKEIRQRVDKYRPRDGRSTNPEDVEAEILRPLILEWHLENPKENKMYRIGGKTAPHVAVTRSLKAYLLQSLKGTNESVSIETWDHARVMKELNIATKSYSADELSSGSLENIVGEPTNKVPQSKLGLKAQQQMMLARKETSASGSDDNISSSETSNSQYKEDLEHIESVINAGSESDVEPRIPTRSSRRRKSQIESDSQSEIERSSATKRNRRQPSHISKG